MRDARVTWLGGWLVVAAGVLAIAGVPLAADHLGHIHIPLAPSALIAAFLFGLLGSTHCFGMCGPLVGLYASRLAPPTAVSPLRQNLLFNLGRTLAYTNLGIVLGMAGIVLGIRPWSAALVGLVAGLFVILMGTISWISAGLQVGRNGSWRSPPERWWGCGGAMSPWPGHRASSIVLLGALHGLLPCPLLYVMFTSAVALGDPIRGGILLFSFSVGTVPMMWGIGIVRQHLRPERRLAWQRVFGGLVTVWALVLVFHGLQSLGVF